MITAPSQTPAARWTAVGPMLDASDELYVSYPFSAPPIGPTALNPTHPHASLWRPKVAKTKVESERRVRHLTSTYHGCPYLLSWFPFSIFTHCFPSGPKRFSPTTASPCNISNKISPIGILGSPPSRPTVSTCAAEKSTTSTRSSALVRI